MLQWPFGRISKFYKGADGLIRVCDIKTTRETVKRPILRLAPLFNDPLIEQSEHDKSTTQKGQLAAEVDTTQNKILEAEITSVSKLCKQSVAAECFQMLSLQLLQTWDNLIQESDLEEEAEEVH
ncbi:hypothetical protein EVAR_72451_1 [Eumeta japonica]|uniref:DUF5641 domain-containing protein n=1 Tax=Eumeta variegata TaxID=151549 RepID=A0A4C1TRK6_EUMVA|nr:hypothetical protein EVAR_72451_1 [Eumeta japonica]